MTKYSLENEKIKRDFYKRQAIKKQEKTVRQISNAIEKFEEFTGYKDFKTFSFKIAEKYIKHLKDSGLALNTINCYLRHLRTFFEWLSMQSGYKSKINLADVELLSLSHNELNSINKKVVYDYPTFEQAKALFKAIRPINEIYRRNKAIIALATLTGMRAESLMTVSIGAVKLEKMEILQSRKTHTKTKFGKDILTKIFNFDDEMQNYFIEWYKYLKEVKLFGNNDPLFPRTKLTQTAENYSFTCEGVEPHFWQSYSSISKVFKESAEKAKIQIFSPHKYRHLSIYLALQKCSNGLEIKAISQHFGHEDIRTALEVYSNLSTRHLSETLEKIDKNDKNKNSDADALKLAQELISKIKGQ